MNSLHIRNENLSEKQADAIIRVITWAENSIKMHSPNESIEEIQLITDIANYWKELIKSIFQMNLQFEYSSNFNKIDILIEKLEQINQSKWLILVERRLDAYLVHKAINDFALDSPNSEINHSCSLYLEEDVSNRNYTGYGGSWLNKSIVDEETKSNKNIYDKKQILDPFILSAIEAINENILIENKSQENETWLEFQTSKLKYFISNVFPKGNINQTTKIVYFNEDKFKLKIFYPSLFLNSISVTSIRWTKENTLSKIREIDKRIKERCLEKYGLFTINNYKQQEMIANSFNKWFISKKQNSLISVPFHYSIDLFQNLILFNLVGKYQFCSFNLKYIGVKNESKVYRLIISLDKIPIEKNIDWNQGYNCIYIWAKVIETLKSKSINKVQIIDGLWVSDTPYSAAK